MEIQEVGKPGFRYRTDFERPDEKLVAAYRDLMNKTGCLTGNVGDCIGRSAGMDSRIRNLAGGMKVIGPALTVKVPPTDNLMIHKALTLIKPGDVLVVDAGGNHSWALMGFLMFSTAMKLGVAGIVVDGCVRDVGEVKETGYPVFAAGTSPNGPFKEGPGEINYPISCGGQVVNPGDMIVADDDGVVVMKQEFAEQTIQKIYGVIEREDNRLKEIEAGQVIRAGIDEMLEKKGIVA
jgi:RraA family protein